MATGIGPKQKLLIAKLGRLKLGLSGLFLLSRPLVGMEEILPNSVVPQGTIPLTSVEPTSLSPTKLPAFLAEATRKDLFLLFLVCLRDTVPPGVLGISLNILNSRMKIPYWCSRT